MKNVLALLVMGLVSIGCAAGTAETDGVLDDSAALTTDSFPGTYVPATKDDDRFFRSVKITQNGEKFILELDDETHALSRAGNVHVFTTGEPFFISECDNPGCSDVVKTSGVLFLKKIGDHKQAQLKLNVTRNFPHPEDDEDLEGLHTTTVRWVKAP